MGNRATSKKHPSSSASLNALFLAFSSAEDQRLNDMLNKEVSDREAAVSDLESRMNGQNDDRIQEIDDLRTKLMRENQFLRNLANKSNSIYFDAYRTKAYDGGGEENLTFQVSISLFGKDIARLLGNIKSVITLQTQQIIVTE